MKLYLGTTAASACTYSGFLLLCSPSATAAFVPPSLPPPSTISTTTVALQAKSSPPDGRRRDMLSKLVLLPILSVSSPASAERPAYLTDPTDEFKANELKAAEFKKQERAIKAKFTAIIDRFMTQSTSKTEYVKDLEDLTDFVYRNGGLPTGIKKDDLYKSVRTKKNAVGTKVWTTDVEVAYQALKYEIIMQQSPNREKDTSNPL